MDNRLSKAKNPYTQVPNELITDAALSLSARAIYAFMLSKPDGWNFTIKSMAKQVGEGERAVGSALKQLKVSGWISYLKKPDGTGDYHLNPNRQNDVLANPKLQNPNLGFSIMLKEQSISNTDLNSNKELSKTDVSLFPEIDVTEEKKKTESKILFSNSIYNSYEAFKNYLLKNPEFKERYRGANLKFYIDAVSKWSDKSGKKTTNRGWCAYLRDFMDRDIKDSKLEKLEVAKTKQEISLKEAAKQGVHFNH